MTSVQRKACDDYEENTNKNQFCFISGVSDG